MWFPRQEYWSGLPFPYPGDLLNPGIKPGSPALQADSLPTESPYPPANAGGAGDSGLIPGSGRSPGVGNGNPLQYSCQVNLKYRGAWGATVHGGRKESDTTEWLSTCACRESRRGVSTLPTYASPPSLWFLTELRNCETGEKWGEKSKDKSKREPIAATLQKAS